MSIAELTIGEAPISAQIALVAPSKKPPRRRRTVAKADIVAQPEAR
jgi:hypothetical protein